MDSPPSMPISPSGNSPLIRAPLSFEENDPKIGSNSSETSSQAESFMSGEDEFDTASERPFIGDPEEGNLEFALESEDSAIVKETLLPKKAGMPVEQLLGEDDVGWVPPPDGVAENPSLVDKGEVLDGELEDSSSEIRVSAGNSSGNPNLEQNSKEGVLDVEEKEPVEGLVLADSVHSDVSGEVNQKDTSPEDQSVDEIVEAANLEPVENLVSEDLVYNNAVSDEVSKEYTLPENLGTAGGVETEPANSVGSSVGVVAGVVENGESYVQVEKDGHLGSGSEEASFPVIGVAGESMPVEAESNAIELGKNEVTDDVSSDQNNEIISLPVAENLELESFVLKNGVGDAISLDYEIAELSADTLDGVNDSKAIDRSVSLIEESGDENAVIESKQASTDLEAKHNGPAPELASAAGDMISVDKVERPIILAEDSKSREAERENLEISGVTENGNAHEIFGEILSPISVSDPEVKRSTDDSHVAAAAGEIMDVSEAGEEDEGLDSNEHPTVAILESSETVKFIIKELEGGSSGTSPHSGFGSPRGFSHNLDGQIVSDSDEEMDTDEESDGKELFDSAALAALLKAATSGSSDGSVTITAPDVSRIFSIDRPAGLGSSVPSLRPTAPRSNLFTPSDLALVGEPESSMDEEEKKLQEKVELIRVKFLRLVHRLGHSPEDTVAAQVLYRLGLAEGLRRGRQSSRAFSLENAKKKALQLEEDGTEDLEFSCNILVLGKTGVGKSATVNSIFGEEKTHTNAFEPETTFVKEIVGTVDGVKIRVIDTPGLRASIMDQASNRRILSSIKKYTKRCPPDIVLYVDRMDTQTRDFNDLPLLRSITSTLGSSIWFNAIVALTHAASAPPDGPNGSPLSYEVFIAQRSHAVQHSIRQAVGDMRLMNPVALVENHPSCRRNREGQRVLPNGLSWRPQMLLLCYSSKILSEANSLLKLQDPSSGKLFGFRLRSPPLPFLLSSLLQSRAHPKLSADQGGEDGDSDIDLADLSDSDQEEDEYDQLPPFKPLRKSQIAKLTKEQRKAYFDEYDYRFKLLQRKQWKEELRRLKEMKKRGKNVRDEPVYGDMGEYFDQDAAPAADQVPLPDMVLPASFDCDNPTYRYRFLEPTSQLRTMPVLHTHGWDHDCGYDGVTLEENLAIAGRFPAGVSVQITKDKKEFNLHVDSSVSAKHGDNGSTLAGFDIQSIGKQLAYILRGETKFKNLKKNKTAAGFSVTFLGENVATGLKIEDQLSIGKRVSLVASTGAVRAQGDVAYGANLEARLWEKDYPIGQDLSTLGLSLMRWRGDLALGANLQSQFSVGRNSKMAVRVGLNNKLSGQITVRTSSSEQLQIALVGILPIAVSIFRSIWPGESHLGH